VVSKLCCPVCWDLIEVLSEVPASHTVTGRHSTLYPVRLPPNLGRETLEKMVCRYSGYLYDAFSEFTEQHDNNKLFRTASNLSSESDGGISIWSAEHSTSIEAAVGESRCKWQHLSDSTIFRDICSKMLPTPVFAKLFRSSP
jgi:hypothetical protein